MSFECTCQHCGAAANKVNVCTECLRSRPIAWKAVVWAMCAEVDEPCDTSVSLSQDQGIRQRGTHPMHSMASRKSKQLMQIMEFDKILYPIWLKHKQTVQGNKGGGGSYADVCRLRVREFVATEKAAGRLVIRTLRKFFQPAEYSYDTSEFGWDHEHRAERPPPRDEGVIAISPWETKYRNTARRLAQVENDLANLAQAFKTSTDQHALIVASLMRLVSSSATV